VIPIGSSGTPARPWDGQEFPSYKGITVHEGEGGEANPTRGGAFLKEEVGHLGGPFGGLDHVRPDLDTHAGAFADGHLLQRVLGGDFQIDH
jgi:hypothetical protein